ncbi:MAG: hypothetical protein Q8M71_05495 [Thermodesulfovibrionales bacterium]|nr:hypothetical protein [Thermodesulfovibrionales bacterium]
MRKIVLGMVVFALASFILSFNPAYALSVKVYNKSKTDIEVNVTRGSTQLKDIVWNVIDPLAKLLGGPIWWKATISPGQDGEHFLDIAADSNTINEILIKFRNENTVTLIDPQLPGKQGATNIEIEVKANGDITVIWLDKRIVSTDLKGHQMFPFIDPAAMFLGYKEFRKTEKFSQYFADPVFNGGLRINEPLHEGDWITLKQLTSDFFGGATGAAKVRNNSKYYKILLRGVDEDGRIKKEEWWEPDETKSFDFRSGFGKKVQCMQRWIAPKCRKDDNACNSSKDEKTPIGWGKWEQSCTNIEFVEIRKSGGGAPDRLGLR